MNNLPENLTFAEAIKITQDLYHEIITIFKDKSIPDAQLEIAVKSTCNEFALKYNVPQSFIYSIARVIAVQLLKESFKKALQEEKVQTPTDDINAFCNYSLN